MEKNITVEFFFNLTNLRYRRLSHVTITFIGIRIGILLIFIVLIVSVVTCKYCEY